VRIDARWCGFHARSVDHPLRSPWIKGIVFLIGLSMVFVLGVMAGLALLDIRSTGAWLAGTEDAEDAEQAVVIARLTREVPDINNADNFTRARAEALRQILLETAYLFAWEPWTTQRTTYRHSWWR